MAASRGPSPSPMGLAVGGRKENTKTRMYSRKECATQAQSKGYIYTRFGCSATLYLALFRFIMVLACYSNKHVFHNIFDDIVVEVASSIHLLCANIVATAAARQILTSVGQ